jgi:hypothetical protein
MSLYYGYKDSVQIDFIIEVKNFSVPYFRCGILFEEIERHDGIIQQEFSLGFFIGNIVFIFYK